VVEHISGNDEAKSSILFSGTKNNGQVIQLVEIVPLKHKVAGSIPALLTKNNG
jgi:hypothetical protein